MQITNSIFLVRSCKCKSVDPQVHFVPHGKKALVNWEVPELKCSGAQVSTAPMNNPELESPHKFGVGEHSIDYSWMINNVKKTCPINIIVKGIHL